jgi:hypothetical protein
MASDIISGAVARSTDSSQRFLRVVAASTAGGAAQSTRAAAVPLDANAGQPTTAPTAAPAATESGAQTFPMEDPAPGTPPK